MDKVVIVLLTVASASLGGPQGYSYSSPNTGYRPRPSPFPGGNVQSQPSYNGYYEDFNEPANYEFRYDVDAPEYQVKFGHQEARQGDVAQGKYYVLLPDGRTQLVEYTADATGYHPRISYS